MSYNKTHQRSSGTTAVSSDGVIPFLLSESVYRGRSGSTIEGILALTIAGAAVVMDIVCMRISNGWILCSLLAGFLHCISSGRSVFWEFIPGVLIPVVVLGWLFAFRMLGPGDIKLFCALGGVMGPDGIWRCMGFSFLSGALISLAILIFCGNPAERFRYLTGYVGDFIRTGIRNPYYRKGFAPENFHFTVPIFMSVMLYAGGMY